MKRRDDETSSSKSQDDDYVEVQANITGGDVVVASNNDKGSEEITLRQALNEAKQEDDQPQTDGSKTVKQLLHERFVEEEQEAQSSAELLANLGCTTMAVSDVSKKAGELFSWFSTIAEEMAQAPSAKPILESYAAICALASATAANASDKWHQLGDKIDELETAFMATEEAAKEGAKLTEEESETSSQDSPQPTSMERNNGEATATKLTKQQRRAAKREAAKNKMQ